MKAVGRKRCTGCGKRKSRSSFHVHASTPDGLQFHCKVCRSGAARRFYQRNRPRLDARATEYRRTNAKKVATYKRAYFEAHREDYNRNLRAWRTKHWKHHYINHQEKRRALIRGASISDFTKAQWLEVLADYGYQCAYCKSTSKLTMDHIVPLSKGGPHTKSNVAPACRPCNSRKRDSLR